MIAIAVVITLLVIIAMMDDDDDDDKDDDDDHHYCYKLCDYKNRYDFAIIVVMRAYLALCGAYRPLA